MKSLEEKFKKYVYNFDINDDNIMRKYYHSLRVKDLCELIAKSEGLNEEDKKIAKIVGLLHDYGRFPQWTEYKTYSDINSIDHGDLGVKLLMEDLEIREYTKEVKNYDEIYDAIKNHNKYKIKPRLSKHNKLLCEIIRDADKLDIFYLLSSKEIPNISYTLTEDEISPKVLECFNNEKLVYSKDIQNNNDFIIAFLAMIYDLNFKYSFEHLLKYKTLEKFYESLENKELYIDYFEKIYNFMKKKVEEC